MAENKELLTSYQTLGEWLTNPEKCAELIPVEDCLFTLAMIDEMQARLDAMRLACRGKAFKSDILKLDALLPNGLIKTVTVSRGGKTEKIVTKKKVDLEKAIKFAQDNNFPLPMTTPQIDLGKIEQQDWFIDNIDQFVTTKEERVPSVSYDRIIIKTKGKTNA